MTPAFEAKKYGFKNLPELARISGFKERTLQNYYYKHPKRFEAICRGAAIMKAEQENDSSTATS